MASVLNSPAPSLSAMDQIRIPRSGFGGISCVKERAVASEDLNRMMNCGFFFCFLILSPLIWKKKKIYCFSLLKYLFYFHIFFLSNLYLIGRFQNLTLREQTLV